MSDTSSPNPKQAPAKFDWLATLPYEPGETTSAMSMLILRGVECVALCTSHNRMFIMRISDKIEIGGPLEFIEVPR